MLTTRIGLSGVVRVLPAGFALAGLLLLAAGFLLLAAPASARAEAMSFRVATLADHAGRCHGRCPKVIVADGQITNSTPEEFVAFLRGDRRRPGHAYRGPAEFRRRLCRRLDGAGKIFRQIGAATGGVRRCRTDAFPPASTPSWAARKGSRRRAPSSASTACTPTRPKAASSIRRCGASMTTAHRGHVEALCARMGVSRKSSVPPNISPRRRSILSRPTEMARWRLAGRAL